jgi:phospholipid transport system substrate-binding protein
LSAEHFSVRGTMLKAKASMKSFRAKDRSDESPTAGRNGELSFRTTKRSNATHASTTDEDARLYRNGAGHESRLAYIGQVLIENRNGLVVGAEATLATGAAECEAAASVTKDLPKGAGLGADKNYDAEAFVEGLKQRDFEPRVAINGTVSRLGKVRKTAAPPQLAASPQSRSRGVFFSCLLDPIRMSLDRRALRDYRTAAGGYSVRASGIPHMKGFKFRLGLSMGVATVLLTALLGAIPAQAEELTPAARRIEAYYQQLLPTIQLAGQLSVQERDRRFGPAITSAFDLATMTRLATGPAWSSFTGAQQAAVREAFGRFLVADYASQINDYSGESFVVEPDTTQETRGGGEVVKSKILQPGGRTVQINYLVRGGRIVDVYFNGTVSDLATRRDEFAAILAGGGGADALVHALRERTEKLLGG